MSFASFLFSPLGSLRQLGFALVVGILIDAMLVRPLLVPCGHWLLSRTRELSRPTSSSRRVAASTWSCPIEGPSLRPGIRTIASVRGRGRGHLAHFRVALASTPASLELTKQVKLGTDPGLEEPGRKPR